MKTSDKTVRLHRNGQVMEENHWMEDIVFNLSFWGVSEMGFGCFADKGGV